MKTTVYFIRHGTTENNIGGRFQGKTDIPLGEVGRKQAACLGERFASVPLDAVYTSPLQRAYQTAQGVCAKRNLQPILCDDLREIDGGALEGRTNDENIRDYPVAMQAFRSNPSAFAPPHGESARQVHARVTAAVHDIVRRHPGQSVAVVSHGFALLCSVGCLGIPFEQLEPRILANASVTCVAFDQDGEFEILFYNDQSHLPEDCQFHSPFWKEAETR
ncbi:MAG: histidine phosphatase family protein [Eubacteriales bacterium]|nr:histidine phosphatase family protein [Eubacteriales bacterium]